MSTDTPLAMLIVVGPGALHRMTTRIGHRPDPFEDDDDDDERPIGDPDDDDDFDDEDDDDDDEEPLHVTR